MHLPDKLCIKPLRKMQLVQYCAGMFSLCLQMLLAAWYIAWLWLDLTYGAAREEAP